MNTISKNYDELIKLKTFDERFEYLKLNGIIGEDTFGMNRWLNQKFYTSREWRNFRNKIITRDNGCDLGLDGFDIYGTIMIHHIVPITYDDLLNKTEMILDESNVICVSFETHNAIHYGDINLLTRQSMDRKPYDTCPWKRERR